MISVHLILFLVALICFILGAIGVPSRVNLVSAGFAFWVLSLMVSV